MLSALTLAFGLSSACGPSASPADQGDNPDEPEIRLPPRDKVEYDCKDIPEAGVCKNDTATFCDKRSSSIVSKRCGLRGLTCEDAAEGARCINSQGQEEKVPGEVDGPVSPNDTGEDCDVYDYIGDCDGNTLNYCTKRDTLYTHDCSDIGATCGFSEAAGYYGCLPPADCNAAGDECAVDEDGNPAIKTCTIGGEGWQVDYWACDPGEVCSTDANGWVTCEPKPITCADVGVNGKCIDANGQISEYVQDKMAYCADGTNVIYEDCSKDGLKCVDPDGSGYLECNIP